MNVITTSIFAPSGHYLVNVGLDIGSKKRALAPSAIVKAFAQFGYSATILTEFPAGSSEATALVSCYVRDLYAGSQFLLDLAEIAELLEQDAVAAYSPLHNEGFLAGPRAADWGGVFSPRHFQVTAGVTLADLPEPFVAGPTPLV